MAGLSPKAKKDKAARDLAFAKTPRRRAMKAENQRKRRAAKKAGKNIEGQDYDHNRNKFVSVKVNRSATKTTNNTMDKKKPTLLDKKKAKIKAKTSGKKPPVKKGKPSPAMEAKMKANSKKKKK